MQSTRLNIQLILWPVFLGCVLGEGKINTHFEYYSSKNSSVPIRRSEISSRAVGQKVVFYVHGWKSENLDASESRRIKDEIFKTQRDVGLVILVNWIGASMDLNYMEVAKESVPIVAWNLETQIKWLHQVHGIKLPNIEMVGHGLGAHIIGQASKMWNAEGIGPPVGKLTGLDAAGPGGFKENPNIRLSKTDATFVRAIHTDPDLGIWTDIGHEDIYPHTQEILRNCDKELNGFTSAYCRHNAVRDLYIQELNGATLVDPMDPSRGKSEERNRISMSHRGRGTPWSINVLVLDVSGSMQAYGRIQSLVIASSRLISELELGNYVGIIIFGSTSSISNPIVNISNENTRQTIISALPALTTNLGATSIGAGLRSAIDVTSDYIFAGHCPNIMLITDGEENTQPFIKDVKIPNCMRINSIALGNDASLELEELSKSTKGQMASATDRNSLDSLTQGLLQSRYANMDPNVRPIQLPPKKLDFIGNSAADFWIDKGIGKNTHFFLSTPDFDRIEPRLTDPDGRIYDKSQAIVDKNLRGISYRIPYATPGNWSVSAGVEHGQRWKRSAHDLKEFANVNSWEAIVFVTTMPNEASKSEPAAADAHITLEGDLSSNTINWNPEFDFVKIQAIVKEGNGVVIGAEVEAIILSPTGQITAFAMLDNGAEADDVQNDGIYSRYITEPLELNLRYEVSIKARNSNTINSTQIVNYLHDSSGQNNTKRTHFNCYEFERQVNLGSVRAVTSRIKPIENPIQDFQIRRFDSKQKLCDLTWTAVDVGNMSDFADANATIMEIVVFTHNRSTKEASTTRFALNDSQVVSGSLSTSSRLSGQIQNVTIQIPKELLNNTWDRVLDLRMYLALGKINSTKEPKRQVSNVSKMSIFLKHETTAVDSRHFKNNTMPIIDLQVMTTDPDRGQFQLAWNPRSQESVEIRVALSLTHLLGNGQNDILILKNYTWDLSQMSKDGDGSQRVTVKVEIPKHFLTRATQSGTLYFIVRTIHNESNFSEFSNLVRVHIPESSAHNLERGGNDDSFVIRKKFLVVGSLIGVLFTLILSACVMGIGKFKTNMYHVFRAK